MLHVKVTPSDVIALLDGSNSIVVEYKYDAWGKPLGKTGSLAGTLGTLNPFRYRGYVYDEETGLYYLRSRYYNPEWGRFISADALMGKTGELFSHNLFCYCGNGVINKCDISGMAPITIESYYCGGYLVTRSTYMALSEAEKAYYELTGENLTIITGIDGKRFTDLVEAEFTVTPETVHWEESIGYGIYQGVSDCSSEVGSIVEMAILGILHIDVQVADMIDKSISIASQFITIAPPRVHTINNYDLHVVWKIGEKRFDAHYRFKSNGEDGCEHFDGVKRSISYWNNNRYITRLYE